MQEIRGVWIPNLPHSQALKSPTTIAQTLDFLQQYNFNVIFPVVWNQGYTLFPSQQMVTRNLPEISPYFAQENFDPLKILVQEAHDRNIAVVPWFEYGFAASPIADGGHILQQYPQWAAIDQTRQMVRHGGLTWMNGLNAEVQQLMLDLMLEVVQKYKVEGIQGCDRFPAMPIAGGYDKETKSRYQQETGRQVPDNTNDSHWVQWRADQLTAFLKRLYEQIKAINPRLVVSMAPAPYPWSLTNILQDSKTWVEKGICDTIHPQLYRESFSKYRPEVDLIDNTYTIPQQAQFAPGIAFIANSITLTANDIVNCVKHNRSKGLGGQVFFHLEGLRANSDEIAIALQASGGYDQIATLPSSIVIV